jgi:hypothetical protein
VPEVQYAFWWAAQVWPLLGMAGSPLGTSCSWKPSCGGCLGKEARKFWTQQGTCTACHLFVLMGTLGPLCAGVWRAPE